MLLLEREFTVTALLATALLLGAPLTACGEDDGERRPRAAKMPSVGSAPKVPSDPPAPLEDTPLPQGVEPTPAPSTPVSPLPTGLPRQPRAAVSFAEVAKTFDTHCVACHADDELDYSRFPFRAEAGREQSVLVADAIERMRRLGPGKMPPGRGKVVPEAEILAIEQWLKDGLKP